MVFSIEHSDEDYLLSYAPVIDLRHVTAVFINGLLEGFPWSASTATAELKQRVSLLLTVTRMYNCKIILIESSECEMAALETLLQKMGYIHELNHRYNAKEYEILHIPTTNKFCSELQVVSREFYYRLFFRYPEDDKFLGGAKLKSK